MHCVLASFSAKCFLPYFHFFLGFFFPFLNFQFENDFHYIGTYTCLLVYKSRNKMQNNIMWHQSKILQLWPSTPAEFVYNFNERCKKLRQLTKINMHMNQHLACILCGIKLKRIPILAIVSNIDIIRIRNKLTYNPWHFRVIAWKYVFDDDVVHAIFFFNIMVRCWTRFFVRLLYIR